MEKEYELVIQEFEIPNDSRGIFDGTLLCLEIFVAKNKAAYDAKTDDPMLQRKDRRVVNDLVQGELKKFAKRMEDEQGERPLRVLDDLFQVLEVELGKLFTPEHEIEFANIGIDGFIQVYNDREVLGRHGDTLLARLMDDLERDDE
ncbi:hypothetical protein HB943_01380 [Listeria weihenstephanensis]|uniref:Uncharacterized protein n=1 Tax=Listeria weihenstephanensis TaxID=1006155 RepID=A0A841Z203_9LIST|nr:hypothetical protein [Listeria weihenstephanensis]MBC1499235.1 hypothetical protein [Listeria weihenstephanensis]